MSDVYELRRTLHDIKTKLHSLALKYQSFSANQKDEVKSDLNGFIDDFHDKFKVAHTEYLNQQLYGVRTMFKGYVDDLGVKVQEISPANLTKQNGAFDKLITKKVAALAKTADLNSLVMPKITDLDTKIKRLTEESGKIKIPTTELDNLTKEITRLTTKSTQIKIPTDELNKITTRLNELTKNKGKLDDLTKKIEGLLKKDYNINLKATTNEINRLTGEIKKLAIPNDKLDELTGKINVFLNKNYNINLSAANEEVKKLTEKIDGLTKKSEKIKIPTDELDNITAGLNELTKKDGELNELTQKIEDLLNKKYDIDLSATTDEIYRLTGEIKALTIPNDKFDELTQKIKDLLNKKYDIDLSTANEEVKKLAEEIKDLTIPNDKLNELTQKIKDLFEKEYNIDLSATTDEIYRLTGEIKALTIPNDKLDKLTDKVNALVVGAHGSNKDLMKELQNLDVPLKKYDVKIIKGNEIADGKYEAKIELEDHIVGTFSPIGYYFYENAIYIYNHIPKKEEGKEESVGLPESYHFIKVVNDDGDHKLAFCNHYGQEYYKISNDDNYKSIDATHIKGSKDIDLEKCYTKNGSNPSFIVKADDHEYPNSQKHGIDLYEIGSAEKIGSLIDEFGYYDAQNKFHYTNQQIGNNKTYNDLFFIITRGDNSCQSNTIEECDNSAIKCSFINKNHTNIIDCSLTEYVANYVNDMI